MEDRSQARVVAQRGVRIGLSPDDFARQLEDALREQIAPRVALVQLHACQRRQVDDAQADDHRAHDRHDAGDLLRLNAQSHGDTENCGLAIVDCGFNDD